MTAHRVLQEAMTAWRIGDPDGQFPIWSPGGALKKSGRWHEAGSAVIYAAEHYSTALLEKLVHYAGALPPNQHFVEVAVPAGVSYEVVTGEILPGWHAADGEAARSFGAKWYAEDRSAVLFVPSVPARMERNLLFNARHPDFMRIKPGLEVPVPWDARLFD